MNASNAEAWREASRSRKSLRLARLEAFLRKHGGCATIRNIGAALTMDHTTIHLDLQELERTGRVRRWAAPSSKQHSKFCRFTWSAP